MRSTLFLVGMIALPGALLAQVPVLTIGGVDVEAAAEFVEIASVTLLNEGKVLVADASTAELRWFDAAGQLVRSSGGLGDGPGEYQSIWLADHYRGDSLFVADQFGLRVTILAPDGTVGRTFRVQAARASLDAIYLFDLPHVVGALSSGEFIVESPPSLPLDVQPGDRRATSTLSLFDAEGAPIRELGTFEGWPVVVEEPGLRGGRAIPHFATGLRRDAGGTLIAVEGPDNSVLMLSPDGRVSSRTTVEAGPEVTSEHRTTVGETSNPESEIGSRPFLSRFPSFREVLVGRDRTYVIADYPVPGESERRWRRFRADGTRLEEFFLPSSVRLTDFTWPVIAGIDRGPFDVPLIRVYRVGG